MAPALAALGQYLIAKGLPLVANAVLAKGKEVVEEKLGVKLDQGMSPEQLLTLKARQIEHEEFLIQATLEGRKLDIEAQRTDNADRDSARKREVEVASNPNAPHIGKVVTPVLAIGTVLGFFSVLGGLLYAASQGVVLADGLKEVLYIMLGVLGTQTTQVYSYYFGSSSGSAQKNFMGKP